MSSLLIGFANLGFLVGILVYKLRTPLKDFLRTRADCLKKEIEGAAQELRQARRENEDYTARLKGLDSEITSLRQMTRQEAESARQAIIENAGRLSREVLRDARLAAEESGAELKEALAKEVGLAAIDVARKTLETKLTGDDRVRLKNEFSKQLGASQ